MIGGAAPSAYLSALQAHRQVQVDSAGMDALLTSHRIPPATLRADDFEGFYIQRQQNLLSLIEGVMGKQVAPEAVPDQGNGQPANVQHTSSDADS